MQLIRVVFFIFLSLPSIAQITPRLFEFGPKAGLTISNFNTIDTMRYTVRPAFGLQGGVFGRLNIGKFSLQPEIIYQAKSANMKKPIASKHTYRYISTPIMVGFSPLKYIYVEGGYERSWAINHMKTVPTLNKPYGPGKKDDESLIAGIRINMLDMFSLFSLNLRYVHGLNNVSELKSNNRPMEFKNRSLQLSVSYTFSEQVWWNKKFGKEKKD